MSTVVGTAPTILKFIQDEILLEDDAQLSEESPLLEGILDSVSIFQLVTFLEVNFGVDIDDGEIVRDHFRNVAAVSELIDEKMNQL